MLKHLLLYLLLSSMTVIADLTPTANVVFETTEKKILVKTVYVNGLVCDFCAQSLEKVLRKDPAIHNVSIDLKTKTVVIYLSKGASLTDKKISQYINDAGYAVDSIRSSQHTIYPKMEQKNDKKNKL